MCALACAHPARTRFSNEYDCPLAQARIEPLGAGSHRVMGCGRTAIYVCIEGRCVQEKSSVAAAPRRSTQQFAPEPAGVSQVRGKDGETILRALARADAVELFFAAKPRSHPQEVVLTLKARGDVRRRGGCTVELLVDGQKRDLGASSQRVVRGLDELAVQASVDVMAEAAKAQRVSGRACDLRFTLDAEDQQVLAEFLTRFQEELAWAGEATPPTPAKSGPGVNTQQL